MADKGEKTMTIEQLPPDNLIEQAQICRQELQQVLAKKLRSLKTAPEGRLRVAQAHEGRKLQYYHVTSRGDTKGTYIPHTQLQLAKRLAQKQYDQKLIKYLRREVAALDQLLAAADPKIQSLYDTQCRARRLLLTPVTLPDEQYAELWKKEDWLGLPFAPDAEFYLTSRKEKVRSKSECIIADALARNNIPYRYEFPLKLKNGDTCHPDFLCLNLRTRQEFIWEHFGMMDSPDYVERTLKKLIIFGENKIFPGKNLIITMESKKNRLKTEQVESLINEFLK